MYVSSILLVIFAILTLFPISAPSDSSQAAPGTPSESTLSLNVSRNTASVDLSVNSTSGTFAKSTSSTEASFNVSTNNYTGYTLTINAPDDTGNLISSNEEILSSIPTSMTEESFNNSTNNGKWGYKPSYYNSETNTSFLPSPTTTATTIDSTSTANTTAKSYTLGLAARADYTTPAGTYNKTFILTATTNPVNYVVEYNANSTDPTIQNIPTTQSGSVTTTSIKLSTNTPTRDKYNFTGWCTVLPTVSGSSDACTGTDAISFNPGDDFGIDQTTTNTTTLYAMWERTVFTCTKEYRLQSTDGSYPSTYTQDTPEDIQTGQSCTYTKTITDYQGNTGNNTARTETVSNITADTTIRLDFPRNTYELTVNRNNTYISSASATTIPAESTNKYRWGQTIDITATVSQGEFKDWTQTAGTTGTFANNKNITTTFTMPKSNATIYADGAIKVQKPGKISYHPNVASLSSIQGEMGDQTASNNQEVVLYAPNFKRTGYGFAGWNTSADGTGTNYGPNETITTPADTSTNGLTLYAKWIQSAGNLQGWNGCDSMDEGDVTALTDTRDNDTYAIAKLADGKCWMIENLRLADKDSNNDINLSTLNTNNPSLPLTNIYDATNPTTSNHLSPTTDPTQTAWCNTNSATCIDQSMLSTNSTTLFTNNTASNYNISGNNGNVYSYGNYYNWYSATAGNGKYSTSANNSSTSGDICPVGWHLPVGGDANNRYNSEFAQLDIALGGTRTDSSSNTTPTAAEMSLAYRSYPNNFIYSGNVSGSSIYDRGSYGNYQSSTTTSRERAYSMYFGSNRIDPGTNYYYKNYGRTVRCIAGSLEPYAIPGTIRYVANANDVVGEMGFQTASNNASVTLYAPNYKRTGYGFAGWNTSADGTGTTYGPNEKITAPSDTSTNGLALYAKWLPSAGDLQGWNGCDNMDVGDITALKDIRDNEVYTVSKLADNNCWITENLRLNPSTTTFTSANTNGPTAAFIADAPASQDLTTLCNDDTDTCIDRILFNGNNLNRTMTASPTVNNSSSSWYGYGMMYGWYAATAGNGNYSMASGNVVGDICPAGWRLPTGGASGEFAALTSAVGGSTATAINANMLSFPNNFIYSGDYNYNTSGGRGSYGRYWSATSNTNIKAYRLGVEASKGVTPSNSWNKWDAFAVRCIAK